jgi:hypothetical protein
VGNLVVGPSPGGGGALVFGEVAAFNAVVEVGVADGAEGFVVEGDRARHLFQLLDEIVEGCEPIGGGGELGFAGDEELLEAAVDELGDFAADNRAGSDSHTKAGGVIRLFKDDGSAIFADALLICDAADGLNIEFETAKFGENVVPGALARFLEHGW